MSEPMNQQVRRSRTVREVILRLLYAAFKGNPDVGVEHGDILKGFATGMVRYTPSEIEGELISLVEAGLIEQRNAPGGEPLPEKLYRITRAGRDFRLSQFRWDRVDEYTGKQELQ